MADRVFLDTNVYKNSAFMGSASKIRRLLVSSVVIQELLVITEPRKQEHLCRSFRDKQAIGEGFVPTEEDWFEVGKCLSKLLQGTGGGVRLSKDEVNLLVRDALIARCAIRAKAVLVTSNTSDFAKIKQIFKSLQFLSPNEYFGGRPR